MRALLQSLNCVGLGWIRDSNRSMNKVIHNKSSVFLCINSRYNNGASRSPCRLAINSVSSIIITISYLSIITWHVVMFAAACAHQWTDLALHATPVCGVRVTAQVVILQRLSAARSVRRRQTNRLHKIHMILENVPLTLHCHLKPPVAHQLPFSYFGLRAVIIFSHWSRRPAVHVGK